MAPIIDLGKAPPGPPGPGVAGRIAGGMKTGKPKTLRHTTGETLGAGRIPTAAEPVAGVRAEEERTEGQGGGRSGGGVGGRGCMGEVGGWPGVRAALRRIAPPQPPQHLAPFLPRARGGGGEL